MVVPCLTCTALGKHEYTINTTTDNYEYHLSCERGCPVPEPVPKEGFICNEYENKLEVLPKVHRSNCVIEIRHSEQ